MDTDTLIDTLIAVAFIGLILFGAWVCGVAAEKAAHAGMPPCIHCGKPVCPVCEHRCRGRR